MPSSASNILIAVPYFYDDARDFNVFEVRGNFFLVWGPTAMRAQVKRWSRVVTKLGGTIVSTIEDYRLTHVLLVGLQDGERIRGVRNLKWDKLARNGFSAIAHRACKLVACDGTTQMQAQPTVKCVTERWIRAVQKGEAYEECGIVGVLSPGYKGWPRLRPASSATPADALPTQQAGGFEQSAPAVSANATRPTPDNVFITEQRTQAPPVSLPTSDTAAGPSRFPTLLAGSPGTVTRDSRAELTSSEGSARRAMGYQRGFHRQTSSDSYASVVPESGSLSVATNRFHGSHRPMYEDSGDMHYARQTVEGYYPFMPQVMTYPYAHQPSPCANGAAAAYQRNGIPPEHLESTTNRTMADPALGLGGENAALTGRYDATPPTAYTPNLLHHAGAIQHAAAAPPPVRPPVFRLVPRIQRGGDHHQQE